MTPFSNNKHLKRKFVPGALRLMLIAGLMWSCTAVLGDDFEVAPTAGAGASAASTNAANTSTTGSGGNNTGGSTSTGPVAECPSDTHACLPEVPAGWSGPLAMYTGPTADLAPGCSTGYPDSASQLKAQLNSGTASCGCSCGTPGGTQCNPVTFNQYANPTCGSTPTATQVGGNFNANQCGLVADYTGVFSGMRLRIDGGGTLTAGSCTPNLTEDLPTPIWDEEVLTCSGTALEGGCDAGQACAPLLPAAFQQICISQTGDVQCPTDGFTERSVAYNNYQDDRACEACTCAEPTGTCGGSVEFRDGSCSGTPFNTTAVGGCSAEVQGKYLFATYLPSPTASCIPGTPQVTGNVTTAEPVTICCLP